jgi:predicted extracellular nuclease
MKKRLFLFLLTLCVLFSFSSPPQARATAWYSKSAVCRNILDLAPRVVTLTPAPDQPAVKAEDIGVLRIATFNMENFFTVKSALKKLASSILNLFTAKNEKLKEESKIAAIAEIIGDKIKPDIAGLQEIEDETRFDKFNAEKLRSHYDSIVLPGNDVRFIQVGSLVNRKYPFSIEVRTNVEVTWTDPVDGKVEKLFSRDAPISIYRVQNHGKPFLITINMHSKAKRNRPGDPESNMIRTAQHKKVAEFIVELRKEFGEDAPIIVMGDTNTDVVRSHELQPIRDLGFKDALEVAGVPVEDRITHTFHPHGGPAEKRQMDAIYLSPSLHQYVVKAEIYRYRDAQGNILPYPETFDQRSQQPSDHYPLYVDIDFSELIRAALGS